MSAKKTYIHLLQQQMMKVDYNANIFGMSHWDATAPKPKDRAILKEFTIFPIDQSLFKSDEVQVEHLKSAHGRVIS